MKINAKKHIFACLIATILIMAAALQVSAAPAPEKKVPFGAWTTNTFVSSCVTSEEQDVFYDAMGFRGYWTGVYYRPIAVLSTQVVAGTNYAFLCTANRRGANFGDPNSTDYYMVKIYKDLSGDAEVSSVRWMPLFALKTTNAAPEAVAGGWTVNADVKEGRLPFMVNAFWKQATKDYTGKNFTPIALLGSQNLFGTNYKILCKGTTVTAKPVTTIDVVTVKVGFFGKAEIDSVETLDVAAYMK